MLEIHPPQLTGDICEHLLIFEYMIFSYLIHFILANLMLASFLSCSNRLRNFLNTIPPKVYFILRVNGISPTNWAFAFPLLRWSPRRFCTPIWFLFCIDDWHSYRASLDSEKNVWNLPDDISFFLNSTITPFFCILLPVSFSYLFLGPRR